MVVIPKADMMMRMMLMVMMTMMVMLMMKIVMIAMIAVMMAMMKMAMKVFFWRPRRSTSSATAETTTPITLVTPRVQHV